MSFSWREIYGWVVDRFERAPGRCPIGSGPRLLIGIVLIGLPVHGLTGTAGSAGTGAPVARPHSPAGAILLEEKDPRLASILAGILDDNPEIAALDAEARSIAQRPAQARSLPDPTATFVAYLQSPETRVGPQKATATLSQRFPWFGKLGLREKAAVYEAAAARARLEARRLQLVTEGRVLYYELGFLDAYAEITRVDRDTLRHFEELARARYAAGIGLQQDVVKIQAEITKDDTKLLEIAKLRTNAVASLNALRDRFESEDIAPVAIQAPEGFDHDLMALRSLAARRRPEVAAVEAEIARAETLLLLARKERDPDFTLGLTYSLVDPRDDPAAAVVPVEDDGQDIFGITFGLNLPIWRGRRSAAIGEAVEARTSSEQQRRNVLAGVYRSVDDLHARIPLIAQQLRLFDDVLVLQSSESRRSVVSAYSAGSVNALDLLDAERFLLDARTAAERTRADYAIALARLEGAIGGPVLLEGMMEGSNDDR